MIRFNDEHGRFEMSEGVRHKDQYSQLDGNEKGPAKR